MIKVLIDENLSKYVATGINQLQYPLANGIEVTSIESMFGKGAKDEEWIPKCGEMSGVFISQDLRIYSTKQQSALLIKNNVGAFFLKLPKGYRYWDKVRVLVKHWPEIVKVIASNKKPFAYFITPRKVYRAT